MYIANSAGSLPTSPTPIVGGVSLPKGRLIVPAADFAGGEAPTAPVLWVTEEEFGDAGSVWEQLAAQFSRTGLWPLVLSPLEGQEERPWLGGELDPSASTNPGDHPAKDVLAEWWESVVPEDGEEPFGLEFPGLAAPSPTNPVDAGAPGEAALNLDGHLGLVSVSRPADVLAMLGWMGPVNHFADMGMLSAVLRSWEDRFGAYVVGIGFDTLTLGVQRPPSDLKSALSIAAEHFAACSDIIHQGAGSIQAYAKDLVDLPVWSFWWD